MINSNLIPDDDIMMLATVEAGGDRQVTWTEQCCLYNLYYCSIESLVFCNYMMLMCAPISKQYTVVPRYDNG